MFGVDDFVLWFAWYLAEDVATHPSTQKWIERADIAINGAPPPRVEEHPEFELDWLTKGIDPPPPTEKR